MNTLYNLTQTRALMGNDNLPATAQAQLARQLDLGHQKITSGVFDYNGAIRAAINSLAQEGLLKVIPKCGIVVTDLTFSDIRMIFEVRALIEPYALRNYGVKLDTDEIVRFAKIFRDNLNRPLDWKMYQLDDQFHSMLISTLPNVYLHDVYSRIQTQNTRLRVMSVQHEIGRSIETCEEHLQITDACLAQDWEAAAQAMTHHLQRSKESSFEAILHGNIQTKFG